MPTKKIGEYIERLNNKPREYDLSKFPLIAECKDGEELEFTQFNYKIDEYDVYALQFGEELYIGSSRWITNRIRNHYWLLTTNKHTSKRMRLAYDKTKSFKAYLLMRCDEGSARAAETAEQMFIRLLRPSLNVSLPTGKTERWNSLIWSSKHDDD